MIELATESSRYEYIRVVEKTNCTDKRFGHSYEWITSKHPEHEVLHAKYVKLKPDYAGCMVRCTKCGKLSNSM